MDPTSYEENKINNQIIFLNETLYYMQYRIDELCRERKIVKYELKNFDTSTNTYLKLAKETEFVKINEKISYFNNQMRNISDEIEKLYEVKKNILNKKEDDK